MSVFYQQWTERAAETMVPECPDTLVCHSVSKQTKPLDQY